MHIDAILEKAQPARLIPTVADSNKEQRIVSVFLATLPRVRPFAERVLENCTVKIGKSSVLSGYTEVEFPAFESGEACRPDGVLRLVTRKSQWTAILEAKVEAADINEGQVCKYAEAARRHGIDAVITLSNQLAALPTHTPYQTPRRVSPRVKIFHLSWTSILTQAWLTLMDKGEIEPDQEFILREMARYLEHRRSGVRRFEQMNVEWRSLVLGVRSDKPFKRTSPEIESAVASWHQEERDVCLLLSRRIGERVRIGHFSLKHRGDPARRLKDACDSLIDTKELRSAFSVPNAAGILEVTANLQRKTISCSMKIDAPRDRKRASSRINWLLKQLREIGREDILIRAFWPGRAQQTQASLAEARENPKRLESGQPGALPVRFEVVSIRDIAGRFSGRKTFIEDIENLIPEFYDQIGQHLRPWTPPPPPIGKQDPINSPMPIPPPEDISAPEEEQPGPSISTIESGNPSE